MVIFGQNWGVFDNLGGNVLKKDHFLTFFCRLQWRLNPRYCSSLFWGGRPHQVPPFFGLIYIFFSNFSKKT